VKVEEQQLKNAKFHSKLDGNEHSVFDCKFDLDKHIQFSSSASSNQDRVVSIYHHPQGQTLKKSSQQSKSCGEFEILSSNTVVTHGVYVHVDYLLFYLCDTEGGSSGSPIVKTADENHRYIIGLHRGYISIGKKLFNYGSSMNAIVNHIHEKEPKYGEL